MKRFLTFILCVAILYSLRVAAQQGVSMDDEPHYSQIFRNDYCRAYMVRLGRLEETKPVVHEHDWVRMTLGGAVEQAWDATVFSKAPYEDPDGYIVSFLYPVRRLALRNPNSEPYQALIVEIMQGDDSRNRAYDPSLDPLAQTLGPGVDPHASYVTRLTKTSVEILNVQLLSSESKEVHSPGFGALVIAMTDFDLSRPRENGPPTTLKLSKGDMQWVPGSAPTYKNLGKDPARFVVLEMK